MNQVMLLGRLTKDPVVSDRKTTRGDTICRFGMAIRKFGKGSDDAIFLDCVAFGKTADLIVGSVRKGHRLLVTGSIDVYKYEKDGRSEQKVEIVVDWSEFIERRDDSAGEPKPEFRPPVASAARVASQTSRPFAQREAAPKAPPAKQEPVDELWPMTDDDTLPF